jgi:hypothetical protein
MADDPSAVADFCNKIGTSLTCVDVGYSVAIGGMADIPETGRKWRD